MNEIQTKILNIFLEVKKICDKHNIRYFAIGGTCLGAARHNGFIPWDDDLDIAIPGDDYKKFYKIAQKELPENLIAQEMTDIRCNHCLFMKVYDVTTTFIEEYEIDHPEGYKGIYIDIMPLYGIPKGTSVFKRYTFTVNNLMRLDNKIRSEFALSFRDFSFKGKIMWILLCPVNAFLRKKYGYKFWSDMWEKAVSKYDFETAGFVGYTWCFIEDNLIFPKEWFDSSVELPFEDTAIRCPVKWDNYLKHQFGDYMKLPPEAERVNHSKNSIIDCNKPFSYYQKKYKEQRRNKK